MASEQALVPEAPVANPSGSANTPATETISHPATETTRTKSLQRSRLEQSQIIPTLPPNTDSGKGFSPSPKSPRARSIISPGFSPVALTGAVALADDQQKQEESHREQQGAMSETASQQALMAGDRADKSKPPDAPATTTSTSEGISPTSNTISIPSPMPPDDRSEISPASLPTLVSAGSTPQIAIAGPTTATSPQPLAAATEGEGRENQAGSATQIQAQGEEPPSNRALTFPGHVLGQSAPPRSHPRGMSLPMPGQTHQLAPRSPSQKKHKCPYCDTEFTRHHNLKSHLLTHSQEKPYVCQTCNARFRRLHDLKRHTKLHTGERPHICPKCDRKFARGDALARHSKGQGGCAGRRASMGSFGGDDDLEDSNLADGDEGAMDGVMYTNGTSHHNEAEMTEEERRSFSLPSIKAQHVDGNQGGADNFGPHSRTYPPAGPRQGRPTGGLFPPSADRGGSASTATSLSMQNSVGGHTTNTSISSLPLNTSGSSMFSQSGMTESPKPLSPSGMHAYQLGLDPPGVNRQRSPSLTTQFQQQHFGRRQSGRSSPPGMPLPSPHTSHGPKLPALAGLAPPDQRYTLSSQQNLANGPQGGQQTQQPSGSPASNGPYHQSLQGSNSGPTNSAGPPNSQGGGNGDNSSNLFAGGERVVLAYVQTLEDKVKQLSDKVQMTESKEKSQEDKINQLSEEVFSLRNQLNSQNQTQPASGSS